MTDLVSRLRDMFVGIWHDADPSATIGGPTHTPAEHESNEVELEAFVDVLTRESRRAGRRRDIDAAGERRILGAFARLATGALRWDDRHLEPLLSNGFRDALRAFPVRARSFDSSLRPAEIYQAARNALTMHCLQALLGVAVESTPAVLGYSLLYPFTDNLLDDESLDVAAKVAFSRRLADRLRGREVDPCDMREARIFQLVAMIEGQYPRERFPGVFASLLAIHHAQERSIALIAGATPLPGRTIVEIGVEKGGTSVLADGYLVAGALTPAQAGCIFGLGVFLQLRDDLEDVEDDGTRGLETVFSAPWAGCLDEPTARALAVRAAPARPCSARAAALAMVGKPLKSNGALAFNVLDTLGLVSTSFGQWGGVPGGQGVEEVNDERYRYLSLQFERDTLVGATAIGLTQHVGALRGLIQGRIRLGAWKDQLLEQPGRFVEAYIACSQPHSLALR